MIALLKKVLYKIIYSFILLSLFFQAAGQDNGNLSYKQLSVNQGLSHSDVTSMAQDVSGHLWLGTHNGLNKYDGQKITVFKNDPQDPNSLPGNRITVLFADKAGNIWIGTERNGLCIYNSRLEKFIAVPATTTSSAPLWITDIKQDKKGTIWAAGKKGLLLAISSEANKPPRVLYKIPVARSEKPINISSLLIADNNKLYLSTDQGIYTCYISERTIEKSNFINNEGGVLKLLKDYTNNIWVARRDGLYKIEGLDNGLLIQPSVNKVQLQENIDKIESIFQDRNGSLWIGTLKDGVYRLKPPSASDYTLTWKVEHPLTHINNYEFTGSFFNIKCFFEDKYGLLWVGTAGGGAIYSNLKNKTFYTISTRLFNGKELINDTYISSVFSESGTLWMGTRKGLCVLDVASGTSKIFLKDRTVNVIYKDKGGIFWIGLAGSSDGLWRMEKSNTGNYTLTKFGDNNALKLSAQSITSITEDDAGRLWVGTINGGINIISAARNEIAYLQAGKQGGLISNNINNVYNDPLYPYMWISYRDKGLARVNVNNTGNYIFTNYSHDNQNKNSLSSNFTWAVKRTKDSSLWIATLGGGLNKMLETSKGPVFKHFTVANGLKDNDIEAMEEDVYGNLWLAGYGLTNFNTKTYTSTFYDYTDGLQSNAFKVGSSFKDHFGRLYFGGINGLNYFDPTTIENGNVTPDIAFTGLRLFSKNVSVGEKKNESVILPRALNFLDTLHLAYTQNDFSIDFIGVQFANALKIKYRYKLSNYNEDWIETSFPSASFAKLAPGTYEFTVYALTGNNVASAQKKLIIIVQAPWWLTWWAYCLYLVIIVTATYFILRVAKRESKLKRDLAIAEKEKELNRGKLEFFTNVSHELRTPMTLIYGPLTEFLEKGFDTNYKEKLWQMYRNAKRILTLTNQLLDFRKMETGHMHLKANQTDITRVITEIFLVFKSKASDQGLQYALDIDKQALVYCDKEKMEIVFTNLLSNAFKYTPRGGSISIKTITVGDAKKQAVYYNANGHKQLTDNYLKVIVTDNGSGISTHELSKIFNSYYQASQAKSLITTGTGLGLSITKGIVDMHHGFITVESEVNKGSVFTVTLPFGKAHLSKSEIEESYFNPDDVSNYDQPGAEDTDPWPAKRGSLQEPIANDGELALTWLIPDEGNSLLAPLEVDVNGDITPLYQLLIVEDNADLLQYLQKTLAVHYKIVTAKDGKEGLLKARQYLPDVILSDVMMPGMDGLEMCKIIKADPELNYIPVILLTARTASVYEIEGVETGADDYLTKPFNFRLLKAKLNNFLTQRENVRQYFKKLIALQPTDTHINIADEQFLDKLIKLVETSLTDEDFSIKKLSQNMAMSQSSLYKRIKDLTGNSVVDFVKSVRIRRAAQLLIQQKMKINEVALEVGITDQKYFREQFRKYFGQTPSEYVKNHKTGNSR